MALTRKLERKQVADDAEGDTTLDGTFDGSGVSTPIDGAEGEIPVGQKDQESYPADIATGDAGAPAGAPAVEITSVVTTTAGNGTSISKGRVTRSQSGVKTPKRPFVVPDSNSRAKKRRADVKSKSTSSISNKSSSTAITSGDASSSHVSQHASSSSFIEETAVDGDELVPTRPNTPEPGALGQDSQSTLVSSAATLADVSMMSLDWIPKARRRGRPLPVPIPNLTKKSRGRRVPRNPTSMASIGGGSDGEGEEDVEEPQEGEDSPPRTYECQVEGCGKMFHRGEHLKRHIRSIHTHEKPFKCPAHGCSKFFSRHDNLLQHQKIHKGELDSVSAESEEEEEEVERPKRKSSASAPPSSSRASKASKPAPKKKGRKSTRRSPSADSLEPASATAFAPGQIPFGYMQSPNGPIRVAYQYFIPAPPPTNGQIPPGMFSIPMPMPAPMPADGSGTPGLTVVPPMMAGFPGVPNAVPGADGQQAMPFAYAYPYGHYPMYPFHAPPGTFLVGGAMPQQAPTGVPAGASAPPQMATMTMPMPMPFAPPEAMSYMAPAVSSLRTGQEDAPAGQTQAPQDPDTSVEMDGTQNGSAMTASSASAGPGPSETSVQQQPIMIAAPATAQGQQGPFIAPGNFAHFGYPPAFAMQPVASTSAQPMNVDNNMQMQFPHFPIIQQLVSDGSPSVAAVASGSGSAGGSELQAVPGHPQIKEVIMSEAHEQGNGATTTSSVVVVGNGQDMG